MRLTCCAYVAFLTLTIPSMGQEPKPLSTESIEAGYRKDKLEGRLIPWSSSEVKLFKKECEAQLKGQVADPKKLCSCAQKAVSENLNFKTYSENTAYQKGRIIGYLSRDSCVPK